MLTTLRARRAAAEYPAWQARYREDRVGFLRDCVDWGEDELTAYQLRVAVDMGLYDREAVRAPRGAGKTAIAALLVHHWALTHDGYTDWKALTTASNWRQLERYLWPEVHKWARRLRWDRIPREPYNPRFELQRMTLRLTTGEASAVASDDPETMEGAHASALLVIFDEAKIIPPMTWQSMEGAFSQGTGKWLAISTPGAAMGTFYDIHRQAPGRERWHTVHINLSEAVEAGRVSAEWAEGLKNTYGESSPVYRTFALAEFADAEANGVIPLSWVQMAQARWEDWHDGGRRRPDGSPSVVTGIGFDVGGDAGGDHSTIAIVYDGHIVGDLLKIERAVDPGRATMELAGRVNGLAVQYRPQWLIGDVIGIGAGVVHRLRELGQNALGYNASLPTPLRDRSGELGYVNWRAAGWYTMAEALDPKEGMGLALPPSDELMGDLTGLQGLGIVSRGLRRVESKEQVRKRLHRSPDLADAVIHAVVGPILFMAAADEQKGRRVVQDQIQYGEWT